LVGDIVPLTTSQDAHTAWYAIETLTVCCIGEQASEFAHVVQALESNHVGLRRLAMRMTCSSDVLQLRAAQRHFEGSSPQSMHAAGLALLTSETVKPEEVASLLRDLDPLLRRYGAIAAKRFGQRYPQLLTELGSSDDSDVTSLSCS
jgi:hypothetical protein